MTQLVGFLSLPIMKRRWDNLKMGRCYYCRETISVEVQKKNRLCPSCGSDLHCCRNCRYFDENLASKCKEPDSEWFSDRTLQNSCVYFEFLASTDAPPESLEALSEAEKAKAAFKALFR